METPSTFMGLCGRHPWSSMDSPYKGTVMRYFDVLFVVTLASCWANSRFAGDLRCHDTHVTTLKHRRYPPIHIDRSFILQHIVIIHNIAIFINDFKHIIQLIQIHRFMYLCVSCRDIPFSTIEFEDTLDHIDGLVQDCRISSANGLEIL